MRKLLGFTGLIAVVVLGLMAANSGAASLAATASGSVTLHASDFGGPNGVNRTFAFSANEASNGTVTGEMVVRSFGSNIVHGNINCMTVEGNQAIVGGVYTKSLQDPTQVGQTFAFAIQDNPDYVTFVNFPFGPAPCDEFLPTLGYADIDAILADPNEGIPVDSTGHVTIQQLG